MSKPGPTTPMKAAIRFTMVPPSQSVGSEPGHYVIPLWFAKASRASGHHVIPSRSAQASRASRCVVPSSSAHGQAQGYGLDAGHAVEQPAGLGRVNELGQGVHVLGGDLAALLLAFLRCVPVSGVGVVTRRHVGGVEYLEGGFA